MEWLTSQLLRLTHQPMSLRSARLDGTRTIMLCVCVCIVTAIAQRSYDVRQISRCVDALSEAAHVVQDVTQRLENRRCK
jgi:hypothetical protein